MTINGQGNEDINGHPGDLIVMFTEKDHVHFVRDGEHVLLEVRIAYPMAVEGGKIEIPTLDGKAELKIPSGIQSGQILRMRGKGFPKLRGGQYGDQLVRIQVSTPTSISKKEKDLLSELASLNGKSKTKFNKVEF